MARNLDHLTGLELAALAAPFENPRYARSKKRKLGVVDKRQKYVNLMLLSDEVAFARDILSQIDAMEFDENDLIREYGRAYAAGRRALSQAEKSPEQAYPNAHYLKQLRGRMNKAFPEVFYMFPTLRLGLKLIY